MSRPCVLSHMTMPITSGQRWGNTWFTKANILETPIPTFLCDEPGCSASYVSQGGLKWHKEKTHGKERIAGAEEDDEMSSGENDGILSEEEGEG